MDHDWKFVRDEMTDGSFSVMMTIIVIYFDVHMLDVFK